MAATPGLRAHTHSHMWLVGLLGLAAGLALLIYVPTLPAISGAVLLFAAFHLVGAVVSLASLYVLTNGKVLGDIAGRRLRVSISAGSRPGHTAPGSPP